MFYQQKQIEDKLNCLMCKNRLIEPKLMPCCGESLCEDCATHLINSVSQNSREYECPICKEMCRLPKKREFRTNRFVLKLTQEKPTEIEHSNIAREFRDKMKICKENIKELDILVTNNGVDLIQNYCLELRTDIDIATEVKIEQLQQIRQTFIEEVNEYEKDLIDNLNENNEKISQITRDVFEVKSKLNTFTSNWSDYLSNPKIDEETLKETVKYMKQLLKETENDKIKIKDSIFNYKIHEFIRNDDEIISESIGKVLKRDTIRERMILSKTFTGEDEVNSIVFSPDNEILASGSSDCTIKLWNPVDGTLIRTLTRHTSRVWSVAFSQDNQMLASGYNDCTIKLYNPFDGTLLRTLRGHTNAVLSVSFSPDNQLLASGSLDDTIKLWNPVDGTLIRTLAGHTADSVWSVVFSPDNQLLASSIDGFNINLWNPVDGTLLRTLTGHTYSVESLAFSQDNQMLASGSNDHTIKLWNPVDGTLIRTLTGHTNKVWSVAFSQDNQLLASGSGDCTIKLWNPVDGTVIKTLTGHEKSVYSVVFSPDNQILASGSADKTIKLWTDKNKPLS